MALISTHFDSQIKIRIFGLIQDQLKVKRVKII